MSATTIPAKTIYECDRCGVIGEAEFSGNGGAFNQGPALFMHSERDPYPKHFCRQCELHLMAWMKAERKRPAVLALVDAVECAIAAVSTPKGVTERCRIALAEWRTPLPNGAPR